MKTKILAIIITSVIVVSAGTTLLVVFIPRRGGYIPEFNWEVPLNATYYETKIKVPYKVTMRDGIQLSTDVYLPMKINESLPVILIRTPYGKDMLEAATFYTDLDYIVILQDFRGFFDSGGEKTLPFITEQMDGHDTLIWIENQPWCDGSIGTWGPSALGIAQYLMAPNAPDSLKCQFPIVATPDIYEAIFRGGQLRRELIIPWMESNGFPEESYDMIVDNEKLNDFWNPGRIINNFSQIHSSSLHLGGWYDIFTQNTIDAFVGYQYSGGEGTKGNAKLIMGPWVHEGMFGAPSGKITYPNQNLGITINSATALFEKWLKDNSTLWDLYPTVAFYLMSSLEYNEGYLANKWYQSNKWPLDFVTEELYFDPNTGGLSSMNEISYNQIEWIWDGNNQTLTIGGGNLNIQAGTYDQSSLESREDVILFTTPVLTEPLTVVGRINVTIFIQSNCTDTDFTVKLTDVYPDNRSMLITDTIIRTRNRNSLSEWEFMEEGEIYEITIPLDSTAYLFNKGHRLRIAISNSNFPRFESNPNTGDPLWGNETVNAVFNTLYGNITYPSKISLPTVDYQDLIPYSFNFQQLDFNLYLKASKSDSYLIIINPILTDSKIFIALIVERRL